MLWGVTGFTQFGEGKSTHDHGWKGSCCFMRE